MGVQGSAPGVAGGGATVVVADHRDLQIAERLAEIQRLAYRVEADLIGYEGMPGLTATARSVAASENVRWFARVVDGVIVGALCEEREGDTIEIAALVVDPAHHRAGHGRALVDACLAQGDATRWIVGTGAANTPAVELYRSLGFEHIETDTTIVAYARFCRAAP